MYVHQCIHVNVCVCIYEIGNTKVYDVSLAMELYREQE